MPPPTPPAPVLVLAFATSGPRAEVGLLGRDGTVAARALGDGAARGRAVLAVARDLLREARATPRDLRGVAADVGPGGFTGTRVGVTAAKSLAFALGLRVVGVSSLELLARHGPPDREVLAIRDAGRGEAWFARYGPTGADGARPLLLAAARGDAAAARAAEGAVVLGEDAERLVRDLRLAGAPVVAVADAATLLAVALPRLLRGEGSDPHVLSPLYLQPSTPELRLRGEPPPCPTSDP